MSEPTLFDMAAVVLPTSVVLSARRRLTLRQHDDIRAGRHPLTRGRLHVDAADVARELPLPGGAPGPVAAARGSTPGLRCGGCRFRQMVGGHSSDYPKCLFGATARYPNGNLAVARAPRYSASETSDVAAFWPACPDHQPVTSP